MFSFFHNFIFFFFLCANHSGSKILQRTCFTLKSFFPQKQQNIL
uniref:Uncharacterized protein n=1 Tax=Anguilla anguilla TaxID=7936 RepID=A0A0E9WHE9_ANGAN